MRCRRHTGWPRKEMCNVLHLLRRTTGYAHFQAKLLLETGWLSPIIFGGISGCYLFYVGGWRVLPERPNAQDFTVARKFVALAVERFSRMCFGSYVAEAFWLQSSYGLASQQDIVGPHWRNPLRLEEECSMCRSCENGVSDTKSFDSDTWIVEPKNLHWM